MAKALVYEQDGEIADRIKTMFESNGVETQCEPSFEKKGAAEPFLEGLLEEAKKGSYDMFFFNLHPWLSFPPLEERLKALKMLRAENLNIKIVAYSSSSPELDINSDWGRVRLKAEGFVDGIESYEGMLLSTESVLAKYISQPAAEPKEK